MQQESTLNEHNEEEKGQTRTQKRAVRTRNKLLKAGLSLFGESGMLGTTIEEITERADVGKGTFYRHFASKEDVFLALTHTALERLEKQIHQPGSWENSLEGRLGRLFDIHERMLARRRAEYLFLFYQGMHPPIAGATVSFEDAYWQSYLQEIERLLEPKSTAVQFGLGITIVGLITGCLFPLVLDKHYGNAKVNLRRLRSVFLSGSQTLLMPQKRKSK